MVRDENMATVYDMSPHLTRSPLRWTGLNREVIHLKKSAIVIPGTNERNEVSTDRRTCRWRCLGCTVENRANEISDDTALLLNVHAEWNLWSVGIVRPWYLLRVRHGPGVYGGIRQRAGSEVEGEGSEIEKRPGSSIEENRLDYKSSGKVN